MQQLLIADVFFQNINGFRTLMPSNFFFVKADGWILNILILLLSPVFFLLSAPYTAPL
jgi:hypothetical protein